jgi:hypothetical protein
VARRQHSGGYPALHRGRQVEQADRVGDLRAAAPDALGQLLVRGPELLEQLLVGGRLFERVQVGAVDVLQQGVAQHRVVASFADDRGDRLAPDGLCRTPTAFAHDQFVSAVAGVAYDDGLEKADLLDGGLELLERFLVEDVTRLLRVRLDRRDGQLEETGTRYRCQIVDRRSLHGRRRDDGCGRLDCRR